jgi:hypothetical protein
MQQSTIMNYIENIVMGHNSIEIKPHISNLEYNELNSNIISKLKSIVHHLEWGSLPNLVHS